ncbi:MAG: hypothetical protein II774_04060, partial [Lachnospiraceae bacterium]|nr:hypothetical protein [Lachnospiraceae bacterium]
IYKAVLAGICAALAIMTGALGGQISSLNSEVGGLRSEIRSLRQELEEKEEESSLVQDVSFEVRDPNYKKMTARVSYKVLLKQYSEDTSLTLRLDDRTIPLEPLGSGAYGADFKLGLFDSFKEEVLTITEKGTSRTEDPCCSFTPFWDLLPVPSLECSLSFSPFSKYGGSFRISTEFPEDIKEASLTYMTEGRDLKNVDVTEKVRSQDYIDLEKGLKIGNDLTARICLVTESGLVVTDQSVLIHHDGTDLDSLEYFRIEDQEGKILWEEN